MSDYFAIVESNGAISAVCKGDMRYFEGEIAGRDTFPLDEALPLNGNVLYYYDYTTASFVSTPYPTPHHTFDYAEKAWSDKRELDEIKLEKWNTLKTQRDTLEFGGFEFEGLMYDSDKVSQGRILGAAMANIDQTWTLQNNKTVELTANELKELFVAMQAHIALTHERSRAARELIYSATTPAEVEAVNI